MIQVFVRHLTKQISVGDMSVAPRLHCCRRSGYIQSEGRRTLPQPGIGVQTFPFVRDRIDEIYFRTYSRPYPGQHYLLAHGPPLPHLKLTIIRPVFFVLEAESDGKKYAYIESQIPFHPDFLP